LNFLFRFKYISFYHLAISPRDVRLTTPNTPNHRQIIALADAWEMRALRSALTLTAALQLAQLAYEIDPAHIQTTAISHEQTVSYKTTASGALVLLPKRTEIKVLVEQMFGPTNPTAPLTQAELEAGQAKAERDKIALTGSS
jgi:hypothetical protein